MMMDTAFLKAEFFGLTFSSVLLPVVIFLFLLRTRMIRRTAVLYFGLALIFLSAVDVVLLQRLAVIAKATATLFDDAIFASEVSAGLYLLPVLSAGIGVNLLSHVLLTHLQRAEEQREI